MTNKKHKQYPRQIHPLIDEETEQTLIRFNVKPSQAIKGYANYLKTNPIKYEAELIAKKEYLKLLERMKQDIDNDISIVKNEIELMEQQKNKSNDEAVENYRHAKKIIDERFDSIEYDLENNKFGIEKMSIKELESIAIEHCIEPDILLTTYPRSKLKKVLENYRKYK